MVSAPSGPTPGPAPGPGGTSAAFLTSAELTPPAILDFEVLRLIGRGGYGRVWLCRSASGSYRAVKVVRRDQFSAEEPYKREFNGLVAYEPISRTHPRLLSILHVGRRDAEGYFFYVMDLADDVREGHPFDPATYEPRSLAGDLRRKGVLTIDACLELGEGLADALELLHGNGLLHRDIKPANVIFQGGIPKLADIGLVTSSDRDENSVSLVGTLGYIAPEGPKSTASDIFSLGKVLYVACTGMNPESYPELATSFAERPDHSGFFLLDEILGKACARKPAERLASARALKEALTALRVKLAVTKAASVGSGPAASGTTEPSGPREPETAPGLSPPEPGAPSASGG